MFERFKALLIEQLDVEKETITPEAKLQEDLGVNSLELAELVFNCEEEFGVSIEEDDYASFVTVGDVVKYLEANAKAGV